MFLNHFLLIWIGRELGMTTPTPAQVALLIAVSVGPGWVSYRLIERPALAWRKRLRQPSTRLEPLAPPTR